MSEQKDDSSMMSCRDFDDTGENADYMHICTGCDKRFIGHKRRWNCKLCEKEKRDFYAEIKQGMQEIKEDRE